MSTPDDRSRGDVSPPRASEKLAGDGYTPPRQTAEGGEEEGHLASGGAAGGLFSRLGGQSGTRGLTLLAVAGAVLLLVVGGVWSWNVARHPQGVPVIGPPPYPVKDRPADPGGMMIMSDDTGQSDVTGRGTVHLAPPPEQPDARLLAGRLNARPEGDDTGHPADGAAAGREEKEASHEAAKPPVREESRAEDRVRDDRRDRAKAGEGDRRGAAGDAAVPASSGKRESAAVAKEEGTHLPLPRSPAPLPPPISTGELQKERHDAAAAPASGSTGAASRYEVQLAALQNEEQARREWDHLRAALPDLLGGREPVFRAVEVGDKHFVRLRVGGFADRAAARRLCVQLHAQARACSVAAN